MAILVDDGTRLLVQGITGREGAFHTGRMLESGPTGGGGGTPGRGGGARARGAPRHAGRVLESGTNVVAGVTPGKGGQDHDGVPVFNTVHEAAVETGANASVIFGAPAVRARAALAPRPSG